MNILAMSLESQILYIQKYQAVARSIYVSIDHVLDCMSEYDRKILGTPNEMIQRKRHMKRMSLSNSSDGVQAMRFMDAYKRYKQMKKEIERDLIEEQLAS